MTEASDMERALIDLQRYVERVEAERDELKQLGDETLGWGCALREELRRAKIELKRAQKDVEKQEQSIATLNVTIDRLAADNARLREIDKAWDQSQENADPELVLTGGILHMLLTQYGEQQADNARLTRERDAFATAVQRYVAMWNNLDVPGDDADALLIELNRLARAALAAPEPK
jgi:chromosome segregation ATPase